MSTCAWAKIIETSDGEHVLFYIENDDDRDDASTIRCVSRHDGFDATVGLSGIPTAKVQDSFDKIDTDFADKIRNKIVGGMMEASEQ